MTEDELLSLPKVRPDEASAFLGGDPTAQYIRLWCQDGDCPFGAAKQQSKNRWTYTINRRLLTKYRRGVGLVCLAACATEWEPVPILLMGGTGLALCGIAVGIKIGGDNR